MKPLLVAVLLALPAGAACADPLYDTCMDAADGTNVAFAQCGSDWVDRADARLNAMWKSLYGAAEGQTKVDLLAEQRLWNAYKEKSCLFYANGDSGREGQVIQFPSCRAEVIEQRVHQLESYGSE